MEFMKLNIQLFAAAGSITCSQIGDYDIVNNRTTERITFTVRRTSGTTWWSDKKTVNFTVDGKHYTSSLALPSSKTSSSCYVDIPIDHNPDGTKYIEFSASIATGTSAGTVSASSSKQLIQIPKASSFTATNAEVEDFTYIHINRASNTFKHRLTFTIGNYSDVSNDVGDNQSYKFLPVWYLHIPGRWATCTIKCETFNGNDKIGETLQDITVYCNEEKCKPNATATIVDTNANTTVLTGDSSKLVKNKSTAKITVTATSKNNATISSVTIDGVDGTVREISNVSKDTFNIVVTDSRGFPRTLTPSATMVEYVPLTMSPDIKRVTQTGQKVKIKVTGNYFNSTFGSKSNTLTMSWSYRQKGSSDWITGGNIIPTKTNNKYEYEITTGDLFDYQKNYEFIIYASDKLTNINSGVITLAKGQGSFEVYKDGIKLNGVFLAVEIVDEW